MAKAGDIRVNLILDGEKELELEIQKGAKALRKFAKIADTASGSVKKTSSATKSASHKFRDMIITLGMTRSALELLHDTFLSIPEAIIKQNAMLERNRVLIQGMAQETMNYADAQAYATQKVNDLLNTAARSPYSLDAVMDSYTKLRVGGVEKTQQSLEALINTSAKFGASAEELKRGSIAIQQMLGKGAVSMEELRQQLGEAIPGIMNIMSSAMAMPIKDMVQLISTGAVEAKTAVASMFAEMYFESQGCAAKFADTWEGVMNQLSTQMTRLSKIVGESGFYDEMKSVIRDLNSLSGQEATMELAQKFGNVLADIVHWGNESIKVLNKNFELVKRILTTLVSYYAISKTMRSAVDIWSFAGGRLKIYQEKVRDAKLKQLSEIRDLAQQELSVKRRTEAEISLLETEAGEKRKAIRLEGLEQGRVIAAEEQALADSRWDRTNAALASHTSATMADLEAITLKSAKADAEMVASKRRALLEIRNAQLAANEEMLIAERTRIAETARVETAALHERAAQYTSFAAKASSVVNGGIAMMGGWLTVITVGVTAAIALYDHLIGKQNEALDNINRHAGQDITSAEYDEGKKGLERLKKERAANAALLKKMQDEAKHPQKVQFGGEYQAAASAGNKFKSIKQLQKDIQDADVRIEASTANLDIAFKNIIKRAREAGKSIADSRISEELNEISSTYTQTVKKLQEKHKNDDQSPENVEAYHNEIIKARQDAVAKMDEVYGKEREAAKKQLDFWIQNAKDERKQSDKASNETLKMIAEFQSEIAKLDAMKKEAHDNINVIGADRLDSKNFKAYQKIINGYKAKIAASKAFVAAKGDEIKITKESAEVEATKSELIKLYGREKYGAILKYAKALDVELTKNKKAEQSARAYSQATVRLGNNITQMAKKLGTAKAKFASNNPLLSWKINAMQTSEVIKQIEEQLKESAKNGIISPKQLADLERLKELSTETSQYQFMNSIKEKTLNLEKSLRTEREQINYDYKESLEYISEANEQAKKISDPARRAEVERLLKTLKQVTVYQYHSQDPFEKWKKSSREMVETIGEHLTGVADDFAGVLAECATNSKASFKDLMKDLIRGLEKYLIKLAIVQAMQAAIGMISNAWNGNNSGETALDSKFNSGYDSFAANAGKDYSGLSGSDFNGLGNKNFGVSSPVSFHAIPQPQSFHAIPQSFAAQPIPMSFAAQPKNFAEPKMQAPQINVINQTGVHMDAKSGGGPKFDGRKMIIDTVLQAASRPGKFRDAMKGIR